MSITAGRPDGTTRTGCRASGIGGPASFPGPDVQRRPQGNGPRTRCTIQHREAPSSFHRAVLSDLAPTGERPTPDVLPGTGFPHPVPNRRNKSTPTAAVETPGGAAAVHAESTAVSDRFVVVGRQVRAAQAQRLPPVGPGQNSAVPPETRYVVVDHAPRRLPEALLSHPITHQSHIPHPFSFRTGAAAAAPSAGEHRVASPPGQ